MAALSISNLILWIIQIFTAIIIIGLARQIGVLHQRVRPLGPGRVDDGPPIGSTVRQQILTGTDGEEVPLLDNEHISLLVLASPNCNACKPMLDSVQSLANVQPDIRFLVAVDGARAERTRYLARYSFKQTVASEELTALSAASRPFAVALASDGTVLQTGIPNTLEQLEILITSARQLNSSTSGLVPDEATFLGHGVLTSASDQRVLETTSATSAVTKEDT